MAWSEANSEEGVRGKSYHFALPGLLKAAPNEARLAAALARVPDEGRPAAALAMASCLRHTRGAAATAALFRLLRPALAQQVKAFACQLGLAAWPAHATGAGRYTSHTPRSSETGACSVRRRAPMASARARCCQQPRRQCATPLCCSTTCGRRAARSTLRLHAEHAPPRPTRP